MPLRHLDMPLVRLRPLVLLASLRPLVPLRLLMSLRPLMPLRLLMPLRSLVPLRLLKPLMQPKLLRPLVPLVAVRPLKVINLSLLVIRLRAAASNQSSGTSGLNSGMAKLVA